MGSESSAVLNTEVGEIEVSESYWGEVTYEFTGDDYRFSVQLDSPDAEGADADELENGCGVTIQRWYGSMDVDETRKASDLLAWVAAIAEAIEQADADRIEAAREAVAKEEEERQRKIAEREALIEERKDRLMNEFVGEEIKVRERGYKTMRRAIVNVLPVMEWKDGERVETGEFRIHLDYINDARTQRVEQMPRVDVKVGSSWRTVWDDGTDDLSPWERDKLSTSAAPAKKYDGELG